MFNRSIVQIALKRTWESDNNPGLTPYIPADNESSVISQLIYDIFGGEILKTHNKRGWHFYNRINGKRYDFTKSETGKSSDDNCFEDIPSGTDEIYHYFEQEQYSPFYMKFIMEFEETLGLKKYRPFTS